MDVCYFWYDDILNLMDESMLQAPLNDGKEET